MTPPNDIVIYYYGGCGGFYLLHLLLLSGYYQCTFNGDTQDLDEIMETHWGIANMSDWKSHEVGVNNEKTLSSNYAHKVFFQCNPVADDLGKYPGEAVIVYTDVDTHWDIITAKKCFFFSENKTADSYTNKIFLEKYAAIKGADWPQVTELSDYYNLPEWIKNELHREFNPASLDLKNTLLPSGQFNNTNIYQEYQTVLDINSTTYKFSLQELVQSQGKVLYQALGLPYTEKCALFTEHYLKLHTPKLQQKLLQ